jgi:5-methylcytosine-specific restriction endonuclease McrA
MPKRQRVSPLTKAQLEIFDNVDRKYRCSRCKGTKSATDFVKDKNRGSGFSPVCKDCRHQIYMANRHRVCAKNKEYRSRDHVRKRLKELSQEYARRRFFHIRSNNMRHACDGQCATLYELASLWKRQRGKCAMTGRRLNRDNAHLDHIVPKVKGGSSFIENLRWVHKDVNHAKRDLLDADFVQMCREVANFNPERI